MTYFLAVLAVFLVAHAIPAAPPVRRVLIARAGETTFLLGYSLLSLTLFVWLIHALVLADSLPLWRQTAGGFAVALILMPVVLVLLGAALPAPNPLSISFVSGEFAPERPGAVAVSRHPLLWGLGLWGLAHVPANGDIASLIFFGGLGLFAFAGMALIERRKRRSLGPARWSELARGTSIVPFAAILAGRAHWPRDPRTLIGAAAGLLVAVFLLAGGHLWLFGRDPLFFFRF